MAAAARLRRAFNYPDSDADSDTEVGEGVSAVDREYTLTDLSRSDTASSSHHALLLVILFALFILLYLHHFTTATITAISSDRIAARAGRAAAHPRPDVGLTVLCTLSIALSALHLRDHDSNSPVTSLANLLGDVRSFGSRGIPVRAAVLPAVNLLVSHVLALHALWYRSGSGFEPGKVSAGRAGVVPARHVYPPGWVPAALFWVSVFARVALRPVDVRGLVEADAKDERRRR